MAIAFRAVTTRSLQDVSAVVPDCYIVGLVGETNCGAEELLALADGSLIPDEGTVHVDGTAVPDISQENSTNTAARPIVLNQPFAWADAFTREKSILDLHHARRRGAATLLYSHDEALIERLCDEVWWIADGRIAYRGVPGDALARYRAHVVAKLKAEPPNQPLAPTMRRGDGRAELHSVEALDSGSNPASIWASGESVAVRITVNFRNAVADPVIGMLIRTRVGMHVFGTNTQLEGARFGPVAAGEQITAVFRFTCALCPHEYTITAASHDADGTWHDWMEEAISITVTDTRYTAGVANLRATVEVTRK